MKKVKRVLILGDGSRSRIKRFSEHIKSLVGPLVQSVRVELDPQKDLSRIRADLMVILGGDGAIISAASRMGKNQIPSIGIQIGRFGFLSELTPRDCEESLEKVIFGGGRIQERMMLACRIRRRGKTTFNGLALNEALVSSGSAPRSASRMVQVGLEIDGGYVTAFHGDGVVVATPVGSTAHSLSAGGPIVEPSLKAIVITPVCSHALAIRPLVVRAEREILLRPAESRNALCLTLDGQRVHRLDSSEEVHICKASPSFRLVRVADRTYFETLRKKFSWGGTLLDDNHQGSEKR